MSQDATVLIVDAHHFHTSLEEQLGARQIYVEHAGAEDAVRVASVMVPDLIVIAGKPGVEALVLELNVVRPPSPIVVVADRAQVKKLRDIELPLAALVPRDLPTAAIAHRIATIARRNAQGEQSTDGRARGVNSTTSGPATMASATKHASTSSVSSTKESSTKKSPTKTNVTARAPANTSLKTTLPGVAVPPQVAELVAAQKASKQTTFTDLSSKSLKPAAFFPLPLNEIDPESIELPGAPDASARSPAHPSSISGTSSDELSRVAQLPIELRVPLSANNKPQTALRLGYLDVDLTRADRLTTALRRKGLDVFPLTPDVEQTRWPLLRRFAPQALLLDEKGMSRKNADWVETFRGDPFLRHVPLIVVRLSRLYQEGSDNVDLSPLFALIERLGQDEPALLEKLAPGRQVDLKLAQVGPVRLLQLLTEQDRNTRIDCRRKKDRIVWPLGPGYAGNAKVLLLGSERVVAKLSPREALAWLLEEEDVDVAVHEHTEPLAHASESVDSAELLRDVTDSLGIPERHESARPAAFRSRPELNYDSTSSVVISGSTLDSRTGETPQEPLRAPEPSSKDTATRGRFRERVTKLRAAALASYRRYRSSPALLADSLPGPLRNRLAAGSMVLVLLGSLGSMSWWASQARPTETRAAAGSGVSGAIPSPAPSSIASEAPSDTQPSVEVASVSPTASRTVEQLWMVAPDAQRPSCDQVLGEKKPLSASETNAKSYLFRARKLLMVGKTEEAVELMCLSAFSDDAGLAPEALAEYYLSRRSLAEAERWVTVSLKADQRRRHSRELLADVENQKGNWQDSRRILLETMRLTGSETNTLQAIGRKLLADARQAVKGGDLPRAERELRRAAVLVPESAGIALELAQVLAERGLHNAGLLWAERAYVLDPTMSAALYYSGTLAAKVGHVEAARRYFDRIAVGDPLHSQAKARLAELARR